MTVAEPPPNPLTGDPGSTVAGTGPDHQADVEGLSLEMGFGEQDSQFFLQGGARGSLPPGEDSFAN